MAKKYENFHFTNYTYKKIDLAYLPSTAYIALNQDTKIECRPYVSIGDTVHEGQLIASDNKTKTQIHSPIPGTVTAFEEHSMPNGTTSECIVIKLDGSFSYTGKEKKLRSWKYDTSSRITTQIRQQGIINTLDTKVGSLADQIDDLKHDEKILGVLLYDYDPSSTVCRSSVNYFLKEIIEGAAICARAMNAERVVFFYGFAMKDIETDSDIKETLSDTEHCFIPVDFEHYPNASPLKLSTLLQKNKALLKEQESMHMQICIDTTTALASYYGIVYELPVTHTFVEVNGSALHEARIFSAKIGTPIKKLLEECGGTEKTPSKIVANGLLKGTAIKDLNIPVTKYLKSITFLASDSVPDQEKNLCIHCGLCRSSCPAGLLPDVLYSFHTNNCSIYDEIRMSAQLCDECALCNTTCPSRLPLYQTITQIKEDNNETKV